MLQPSDIRPRKPSPMINAGYPRTSGSGLGAGSHSREQESILSAFAWDAGECMGEGCREVPIRYLAVWTRSKGSATSGNFCLRAFVS